MKLPNLILALAVSSIVFLNGCSKSSDNATPKTKTELLTQGPWKYKSALVSGIDVSAALQTCQKDNIATFAVGGTGTLDEGAAKCNSGDPQTISFNWSFESNETILNVSTVLIAGGSNKFDIVRLTATELVVSQNITVGGSSQTAIVTFIH